MASITRWRSSGWTIARYEEPVFRGFLLGGMSRHISFDWANAIQATLFAFVHNDSLRFVFYPALGLLYGWLVRKSRSLGLSIALHSASNTLATVVRVLVTGVGRGGTRLPACPRPGA